LGEKIYDNLRNSGTYFDRMDFLSGFLKGSHDVVVRSKPSISQAFLGCAWEQRSNPCLFVGNVFFTEIFSSVDTSMLHTP